MKFFEKNISSIVLVLLIIIWQMVDILFAIPTYILPSPLEIFTTLITNFKLILIHSAFTITEALIGIVIAIIVGIMIATILFNNRFAKRILLPYISILQTIPAIVIAPLFAMWFGFGLFPKVLLIVIFCSFPIIISTLSSFEQVSSDDVLYLKTLGASKAELFKHLYLPAAGYEIFASVRIATTYALVNAIFAEYMGAKYGLGVYLNRASKSFSTPDVFAIIIVIIIVTLSLLKLVDVLKSKIIKWG